MSKTYYVVPNSNGYGDWSIITGGGRKEADAQTQQTAINKLRRAGAPGLEGDQVIVYGNRKQSIVDNFTLQ